jgi:hypothetical protein
VWLLVLKLVLDWYGRIFICIEIESVSYLEKLFTANVQNVGLRVNLRYYQVILGTRNLGAICVITNLQWMNFKNHYSVNRDCIFTFIISDL